MLKPWEGRFLGGCIVIGAAIGWFATNSPPIIPLAVAVIGLGMVALFTRKP